MKRKEETEIGKDTVVDHRSAMMNTANNKVMRTDRVLTTYKKPTSLRFADTLFEMIMKNDWVMYIFRKT